MFQWKKKRRNFYSCPVSAFSWSESGRIRNAGYPGNAGWGEMGTCTDTPFSTFQRNGVAHQKYPLKKKNPSLNQKTAWMATASGGVSCIRRGSRVKRIDQTHKKLAGKQCRLQSCACNLLPLEWFCSPNRRTQRVLDRTGWWARFLLVERSVSGERVMGYVHTDARLQPGAVKPIHLQEAGGKRITWRTSSVPYRRLLQLFVSRPLLFDFFLNPCVKH